MATASVFGNHELIERIAGFVAGQAPITVTTHADVLALAGVNRTCRAALGLRCAGHDPSTQVAVTDATRATCKRYIKAFGDDLVQICVRANSYKDAADFLSFMSGLAAGKEATFGRLEQMVFDIATQHPDDFIVEDDGVVFSGLRYFPSVKRLVIHDDNRSFVRDNKLVRRGTAHVVDFPPCVQSLYFSENVAGAVPMQRGLSSVRLVQQLKDWSPAAEWRHGLNVFRNFGTARETLRHVCLEGLCMIFPQWLAELRGLPNLESLMIIHTGYKLRITSDFATDDIDFSGFDALRSFSIDICTSSYTIVLPAGLEHLWMDGTTRWSFEHNPRLKSLCILDGLLWEHVPPSVFDDVELLFLARVWRREVAEYQQAHRPPVGPRTLDVYIEKISRNGWQPIIDTLEFFRLRLRSITLVPGMCNGPSAWMDEVTGWWPPETCYGHTPEAVQRVQDVFPGVEVRKCENTDAMAVWRGRFRVGWDGMLDWGGSSHTPRTKYEKPRSD